MWILKNYKELLEYIQSRSISSYNNIKHFTSLPSTQLSPTQSYKRQIKRISPSVFHEKEWPTYYFVKKPLCSTKRSLKLISSECSSFWLTTYLLCLMDVFFNRQSAYLWVQIVHLFSPTLFVRGRHTGVSTQKKNEN